MLLHSDFQEQKEESGNAFETLEATHCDYVSLTSLTAWYALSSIIRYDFMLNRYFYLIKLARL